MKIIAKTVELTKRPKKSNLRRGGNFCVYPSEVACIEEADTIVVKILNLKGELVAEPTYSGREFLSRIVHRTKRVGNRLIKFMTVSSAA